MPDFFIGIGKILIFLQYNYEYILIKPNLI